MGVSALCDITKAWFSFLHRASISDVFAARSHCCGCTPGAAGASEWSTVRAVCSGLRAHAYMQTHYRRQKYLWPGLKLWTKNLVELHIPTKLRAVSARQNRGMCTLHDFLSYLTPKWFCDLHHASLDRMKVIKTVLSWCLQPWLFEVHVHTCRFNITLS